MKAKLLKRVRQKFQIEHKHTPSYILYRVVEYSDEEHRLIVNEWNLDQKLMIKIRRRMILSYCRLIYKVKKGKR